MDILKYADINPAEAGHMAQRLHRKKDDLSLVRKFVTVEKVEAIDEERSIVARVSTNDRDRDGEVVEPKGIDLSNYTKNPCLLWAHQYDIPAIGKALWAKTDDKGLICKFQFAPTLFADEIYQLYKGGYQRAFSIGFIPLDFDSVEKVHRKVSLLEVSAVPVPANQDALVMEAYAKGIIKSGQLMQDLNIVMTPVSAPMTDSSVQPKIDFCDTCGTPQGVKAEVVTKPETTDQYHRIPVSDGHEGHDIRTITVSEKDGIKALYCYTCKEIKTYLFDVDRFTQAEAEAWVEEHKKSEAVPETKAEPVPPAPDLAAELASLRADIAAVMALIQAGKVAEPAVEAVAEVAPDDIAFEPSIAPEDITIEPDVPDKAIEERIDKLIQGFDYKQTVKEAVEVALAKLTGRVI